MRILTYFQAPNTPNPSLYPICRQPLKKHVLRVRTSKKLKQVPGHLSSTLTAIPTSHSEAYTEPKIANAKPGQILNPKPYLQCKSSTPKPALYYIPMYPTYCIEAMPSYFGYASSQDPATRLDIRDDLRHSLSRSGRRRDDVACTEAQRVLLKELV